MKNKGNDGIMREIIHESGIAHHEDIPVVSDEIGKEQE